MRERLVHSLNAASAKDFTLEGMVTVVKFVAYVFNATRVPSAYMRLVRSEQLANALLPMLTRDEDKVTLFNLVQFSKEQVPIVVTEFGTVMVVRPVFENA